MSSGVLSSLKFDQGVLAAPDAAHLGSPQLDRAVNGLRLARPALSAFGPIVWWQRSVLQAFAVILPLAAARAATGAGDLLAVGLTLPFACIIIIRVAAVLQLAAPLGDGSKSAPPIADCDLPFYSVLVPLYLERDIVPALLQALSALDYPHERLEVLFVTEDIDAATRAALINSELPAHMRVITVPPGVPQTKPRALNFAMQFAQGSLVTVYDAEDVPTPRQLRAAAEHFAQAGPELACLQARLGTYNLERGFLTRQFTLEYAALFEAILPVLQRLGLPILLGGTSNHFRRCILDDVGGWDPFNVTEDADLGVRLARSGKQVAMLDSDTWEEAPEALRAWIGQRTRWLKGWMQTYLVHMREPRRLWQDLGPWRFFGLQVTLGGMILSALVHPWFYVAAFYNLSQGQPFLPGGGGLWVLCWFNLWAGYTAGIVLGLIAAWRSQGRVPVVSALLVPAILYLTYHENRPMLKA